MLILNNWENINNNCLKLDLDQSNKNEQMWMNNLLQWVRTTLSALIKTSCSFVQFYYSFIYFIINLINLIHSFIRICSRLFTRS